jgi:hypothetical protein
MKTNQQSPQHGVLCKSILIALAAIVLFAYSKDAFAQQWTGPDGSNNISNANTGNVAIGTSGPGSRLEVKGSGTGSTTSGLNITNSLGSSELFVRDDGFVGFGTSTPWFGTEKVLIQSGDLVLRAVNLGVYRNNATPVLVTSNGNVAINGGTPREQLEVVAGNVITSVGNGSYYLTELTNSGNAGIIQAMNLGTVKVQLHANGDSYLLGGNVGIGTNTPGYKLDVQGGQVNASGGLCIAGDCKTAWSQVGGGSSQWTTSGANIYYNSGNVGVGTTSPNQLLNLRKDQNSNTIALVENQTAGTGAQADFRLLNDGGKLGQFGIFSSATNAYGALVANDVHLYSTTNLGLMADSASGIIKFATGGNSERARIDSSGNVGIGTTSPGYTLQVNGADSATSGLQVSASGSSAIPNAGSISNANVINNRGYNLTTDNVTLSSSYQPSYGIGVATNRSGPAVAIKNSTGPALLVEAGNVGIGTTTPGYKFDVQGGQINTSGGLCIAGDCKTAWSQVGGGGSSQWITSGANIYYNSGNVGIGTTSPGQKLDVSGTIRSTGGTDGTLILDGTAGGEVSFTKSGTAKWALGTDVGVSSDDLNFYNYSTGSINLTIKNASGNVGIGFSGTPGNKLDVNGSLAIGNSYIGTAAPSNGAIIQGSVGIGTTSPNRLLEVKGTANDGVRVDTPAANNAIFELAKAGTLKWQMYVPANSDDLRFYNGGDKITFQSGGNVHIAGSVTVDGNIAAKYQDVAEWVPAAEQIPAGTVVVLDPTKSNQVISSTISYDTRVAGVISAKPGIALGESGNSKVLVATTGRVRVKVDATRATIHVGDLLVTSDIPGMAMKSEPVNLGGVQIHRPGTLIGKALEPLAKGAGEILVLLSLQ